MRRIALVLVLLGLLGLASCRKRPPVYDRSTPEATLAAFFTALNHHRLAADLEQLIVEPTELGDWQFRCEQRGCRRGSYTVLRTEHEDGVTAGLVVDYEVRGDRDVQVMAGKGALIQLQRIGEQWMLVQFGDRVTISSDGTITHDGLVGDAAAPILDGGILDGASK